MHVSGIVLLFSLILALVGCNADTANTEKEQRFFEYLTGDSLVLIEIKGSSAFVDQTEQALSLLQKHAPDALEKVQKYVGIIEQGEHSAMWAYDKPPRFEVNDATAFYSVTWYAGAIAHDATHSEIFHEYQAVNNAPVPDNIWKGQGAELFCIKYQIDVLKRIGAPQYEIEHSYDANGTHCDIDGDGDCDWDDYHGRDW